MRIDGDRVPPRQRAAKNFMQNIQIPDLSEYLPRLLAALPAALAIIVGAILLNVILARGLKLLADKTRLTDLDVLPFRKFGGWLIYASAGILLLSALGFDIGGIWTILATVLGLVAIGFVAVWSVLSNTLCTVMILFFKPFAIGDEVEFAGEQVAGRVIDMNFMFTTLATKDGAVMQVPNNLFFQKVLKRRHSAREGADLADRLHAS